MDAESSDDLTLIAAETIKTLVFEILSAKGEAGIDPKGAKALADALRSATLAQNVSTQRRKTIQQEYEAKAEKAIERVAKEKGLSADTISQLRHDFLGVRPKAKKDAT